MKSQELELNDGKGCYVSKSRSVMIGQQLCQLTNQTHCLNLVLRCVLVERETYQFTPGLFGPCSTTPVLISMGGKVYRLFQIF